MLDCGLIEVYTGDGKGKTTAALGLAMRAMGYGLKVVMIQFLKGGDEPGEVRFAKKLGSLLEWHRFGTGEFIINRRPTDKEVALAREGLALAERVFLDNTGDVLILDEISHAINLGLVKTADVLSLIDKKPKRVELVMTGRDFPQEILNRADLVSEVRMIRHPYNDGIPARQGIDY